MYVSYFMWNNLSNLGFFQMGKNASWLVEKDPPTVVGDYINTMKTTFSLHFIFIKLFFGLKVYR